MGGVKSIRTLEYRELPATYWPSRGGSSCLHPAIIISHGSIIPVQDLHQRVSVCDLTRQLVPSVHYYISIQCLLMSLLNLIFSNANILIRSLSWTDIFRTFMFSFMSPHTTCLPGGIFKPAHHIRYYQLSLVFETEKKKTAGTSWLYRSSR